MKEGYKESALGLIPKSWAVTNIGDVATKVQDGNYGASYPKSNEFLAEGVPFLTSSTISSNIVNFDKLKYISEIKHIELKKAHIKENDVILTNRGANVGKCAITTPSLEDANIGPQVTLIRCKKDYDYNLLHQVIMSSIIQKQIANINSGSAMNFLSLKVTNALQIPFPPLSEQQKIAEILSTVDAKIEIIDQQISETQELKKGLMQQLLTKGIGHTEFKDSVLGKIPKSWEVVKISKVADVKGGKRIPKGESLTEEKTSHPYIRVADMFMGGVSLEKILYVPENIFPIIKKYTISKDDLFISVAGTLGIVGEIPNELDGANLTENADKLSNIKISKLFLLQVLLSPIIQTAIEREKTNNAQPKLALAKIRSFEIPKPSKEEQLKIAEILSTTDKKLEVLSEKKTTYQELKQGLMQQLLTGKVRV